MSSMIRKSNPIQRHISLALSVLFASNSWFLSTPESRAQGTLQTWNINARERSRRLTSAALNHLTKGQLEQASNLLVQATNTDPSDPLPLETLGMTYLRQGKSSQALDALKKAYDLIKDPETLLSTGFAYYLEHDYDAAINAWQKTLERAPQGQMAEAQGNIGFAYLRKGDFEKADAAFRALLRTKPSSQLAYHGLAIVNYLAGNFAAARKAADHAQSIQSYYPVILLLAKLDYLQGDPQAGQRRIREWQTASTARGSSKKTSSLQRPMTAIGYPSQHDFRWDPFLVDNFDTGRFLAARTQDAQSRKKSKEREARSGKKSDSKKKTPSKNARVQDALRLAQNALDSAPTDFYIMREVALLELTNGDFQESADHFARVLNLCPSCSVDWLHLAVALNGLGKEGEAAYGVQEFQRKHPNERLAPDFAALAKGQAVTLPNVTPVDTAPPKQKDPNETGF